jgi:peptidoglycan/LPS O-acetylase OafA/YrhL
LQNCFLDGNLKGNDLIKGLNGVRCLAAIFVVATHLDVFVFGWVGLQMFFVLSGFLITKVLLGHEGGSLSSHLRTFYGRRALRIFPAYYVFFLLFPIMAWLINAHPNTTDYWGHAAAYFYNWTVALDAQNFRPFIGHFWSLCVEEQFYLVWPLVLFFTPKKRLHWVLIGIVILAPVCRYFSYYEWSLFAETVNPALSVYMLPMTHMDAFAMGGLLNLLRFRVRAWHVMVSFIVLFLLGYINSMYYSPRISSIEATSLYYPLFLNVGYQFIWGYSIINGVVMLMIAAIIQGNFVKAFFENPMVDYIGRISYPIYIFNIPLIYFILGVSDQIGWGLTKDDGVFYILNVSATLIVAAIVYHFIEQPCSRLKSKIFPYKT